MCIRDRALSDYNHLRRILDLEEAELGPGEYLVHCDTWNFWEKIQQSLAQAPMLSLAGQRLTPGTPSLRTEPMEQYLSLIHISSYQQGQESLLAKAQGEQAALQQAGTVYETTLLLKGIGQAEGQVLTLSWGEQVYLSLPLAPGQERLTLYNTPAGEYSEGVLLPHLPSYQVSLCLLYTSRCV